MFEKNIGLAKYIAYSYYKLNDNLKSWILTWVSPLV